MRRALFLFLLLAFACRKTESMSTADFVKEVASQARPKTRVQVIIRASAEEATDDDKALLKSIEEAIERDNVGAITSSGFQPGTMFVNVDVENTADATTALKAIVKEKGVRNRTTFRIIQSE